MVHTCLHLVICIRLKKTIILWNKKIFWVTLPNRILSCIQTLGLVRAGRLRNCVWKLCFKVHFWLKIKLLPKDIDNSHFNRSKLQTISSGNSLLSPTAAFRPGCCFPATFILPCFNSLQNNITTILYFLYRETKFCT